MLPRRATDEFTIRVTRGRTLLSAPAAGNPPPAPEIMLMMQRAVSASHSKVAGFAPARPRQRGAFRRMNVDDGVAPNQLVKDRFEHLFAEPVIAVARQK